MQTEPTEETESETKLIREVMTATLIKEGELDIPYSISIHYGKHFEYQLGYQDLQTTVERKEIRELQDP